MYLTCAATVRCMSESCPLASRTRAEALGSERRNPPLPQQSLDAIRRQSERRQDRGVGGVGIYLTFGAEHGQAFHQPAAPYQAGCARPGVALGGDIGAVKNLGGNASHRK